MRPPPIATRPAKSPSAATWAAVGTVAGWATATCGALGTSTTAFWSGIPSPTAKDWIGLYREDDPDTAFSAYVYTTGTSSGSKPFTVPAGLVPTTDYELRLFANDGFTRLAISGPINVHGPASVSVGLRPVTVPT